jgi:mannose-6-phosphate isomerase-like protein (cupin superfamily)
MTEGRIVKSGEGDVVEGVPWLFKAVGEQTDGHFDLMVGEVEYLTGPPLHVHADQDDSFLVLEGTLAIQVGEELFDVGPGDFATVPPGVAHTFDNIRQDQPPVRTINLMTPGGLHAFFAHRAKQDPGVEPAEVKQLAESYGMEVVGPTLGEKLGLS